MQVSLSWLREWVDFEGAPERVAEVLTHRGFYVEGIETHGASFPGVVVARVLDVKRHPNADRLILCRVDGGTGELSVVCGAPNVVAGMVAPLATVGATLPGGVTIKKSKIRGETSEGMLCSARELELSDDHEGIVDLERYFNGRANLAIGRPLDEFLPPPDPVFSIEIPFNRPDGLGVIGLAREVKAGLGGSWTKIARERLASRWKGPSNFDLELEDAEGCPWYLAQCVQGVAVGPSPAWIARRLEACGQRPISNVVDVTNLVLLEFGQPLHAFDLDRLKGPAIRVRSARKGERITTLDGKTHTLDPDVLVIADREDPVAIAGIMGGAASEVSASTTRLMLECAWFDPRRVRRGARRLGFATEASKRFERCVDPAIGHAATRRFLELLSEVSPGARTLDAHEKRVRPIEKRTLTLRMERCARLIGADVGAGAAKTYLEDMEFRVRGRDPLEVEVPTWRPDVLCEDDLVEEVARSWGYDRIPEVPLETGGVFATRSRRERMITRARTAMLARGLSEAWTTTLVSEREALQALEPFGEEAGRLVRLANPMSREHEVLRPNLVPGLLRATAHNLRQGATSVRLFEVGAGFLSGSGDLPEERLTLAAVLTGQRYAHAHDDRQGEMDFDDARGLWDAWLGEMRVDTPEWRSYSAGGWKPGASAEVAAATSRIGWAGMLGRSLLRVWDIEVPVHLFVVHLDALPAREDLEPATRLPGRFPPVRRDLAFFVPAGVSHRDLERTLTSSAGECLASVELFDVYTGPGTPQGMKSLAYALRFQHDERTLTEAEVQTIQDQMVAAVATAHGGQLRER